MSAAVEIGVSFLGVVLSFLGALLAALVGTGPADAVSHIREWWRVLFGTVPAWLQTLEIGAWAAWLVAATCVALALACWLRFSEQRKPAHRGRIAFDVDGGTLSVDDSRVENHEKGVKGRNATLRIRRTIFK